MTNGQVEVYYVHQTALQGISTLEYLWLESRILNKGIAEDRYQVHLPHLCNSYESRYMYGKSVESYRFPVKSYSAIYFL